MRRRSAGALLAVGSLVSAVSLLVSGCGGPVRHAPSTSGTPGAVPQPQGVRTSGPGPASGVSVGGCDASLRPSGSLPAPGAMPAGSTMERIARRGYLVAGVDQDTYLFGYRNPSADPHDAPVVGFDVDIARQVAAAIFGSPDRIRFKVVTQAGRIPALQSGAVDMVADIMTIDCERARLVSFSSDYFDAGQRLLVNGSAAVQGVGDLAGRRVCAPAGTTSIQKLADPSLRLVPVAAVNWSDCLVMLQQGQVDAVSTTDLILLGLAEQDPYTRIVGPRLTFERHGLGVPKGEDDMVRFVNGVLERMRSDGTWSSIYGRWIGTRLGPVPAPPSASYR